MAREPRPHESYEEFLRASIKAYWDSGKRDRVNFLALLFACRETWQVAWGEASAAPGKVLTGAAGAAAVAVLLRTFLGGPVGILLTGATLASLVAVYVKNHERIWAQVTRYRGLIGTYRERYGRVCTDYVEGEVDREQRDLMLDGLMSRFLSDLDAEPEDWAGDDEGADDSFEGHVGRRRDGEPPETKH